MSALKGAAGLPSSGAQLVGEEGGAREPFGALATDRRRGARGLGLAALAALETEVRSWDRQPEVDHRARLRRLARLLRRAQPAMGPFVAWSGRCRELAASSRPKELPARVRAWLSAERRRLRAERPGLARTVARVLPRSATVLTMSRSETVFDALTRSPGPRRPRRVVVLASFPGGEGRRFAAELRAAGLPARCVADRDRDKAARRATLVMVGADAVEANGTLIHKVGTRPLAEAARRAGVPFVTVFGSSKRLGRELRVGRLPPLFDRTPRALVTGYWTDRGVSPGDRSGRGAT